MAVFVAISGPSVTGKTSLIDSLCSYPEMGKFRFSPDFKDSIWNDLVSRGVFTNFTDITTDSDYICAYLHKLVDQYNRYIEEHEHDDDIIILDGCWIDYFIYSLLSMWYSRVISSAQEEVFSKILKYKDKIDRYYFTQAADSRYPVDKFRVRGRMSTFKKNRPLEISMYEAFSSRSNSIILKSSEVSADSMQFMDDFRKLGYLSY